MSVKGLIRPKFSLFLLLGLLLALMLVVPVANATVKTDAYYYSFGDIVQITGDGMQPGESVSLEVRVPDGMMAWTVAWTGTFTADGLGNFDDIFVITPDLPAGEYVL